MVEQISVWLVLGSLPTGPVSRMGYALTINDANAMVALFQKDDPLMEVELIILSADKYKAKGP